MWLTLLVITLFAAYQLFLCRRGRFFFTHSLFLVPLQATIFFVDHNASRVIRSLAKDSVDPVFKLIPVYLTILLLARKRVPSARPSSPVMVRVINFFLTWVFASTLLSAILLGEWTPVLIASFTTPLFWLLFNSQNVQDELAQAREAARFDKWAIQLYYLGFVFVYFASLYYSISSGITTSLLDSRSAGSIFASTSAVVFCALYAPFLVEISGARYAYWVMAAICVLSLSKTALFLLPITLLAVYKGFRAHFRRNKVRYLIAFAALLVGFIYFTTTPAFEVLSKFWVGKFTLGHNQSSILDKAYFTRMKLYHVALDLIARYPLGIGMGNYELFQPWGYKDPHNFVLTVMVENGWIAGPAFLVMLFIVFAKLVLGALRAAKPTFLHLTLIPLFMIYFTSSGVLATTGYPDQSVVYYSPLYGAAIFYYLNLLLRSPVAVNASTGPRGSRFRG